jgi:hypothetical protein
VEGWHFEVREYHQEDEEVVHAKRPLNYIACGKRKSSIRSMPDVDDQVEGQGHGDPDCAPQKSFIDADLMGLSVENAKIKGEQNKDGYAKEGPQQGFIRYQMLYSPLAALFRAILVGHGIQKAFPANAVCLVR